MRIIPKVMLLVTLSIPLTSCSGFVTDYKILESYVKSPTVEYANVDAWRCDLAKSTNTQGVVEDCGACRNVSGLS